MNHVKKVMSGFLVLLLLLTITVSPMSPVFAETGSTSNGTTYYVDADNGNDSNPGTSPAQAWKSLTKVTATTFQPGDQILLKSGCVWNGEWLWPKGSGTEDAPIKISYKPSSTRQPSTAVDQ